MKYKLLMIIVASVHLVYAFGWLLLLTDSTCRLGTYLRIGVTVNVVCPTMEGMLLLAAAVSGRLLPLYLCALVSGVTIITARISGSYNECNHALGHRLADYCGSDLYQLGSYYAIAACGFAFAALAVRLASKGPCCKKGLGTRKQ